MTYTWCRCRCSGRWRRECKHERRRGRNIDLEIRPLVQIQRHHARRRAVGECLQPQRAVVCLPTGVAFARAWCGGAARAMPGTIVWTRI